MKLIEEKKIISEIINCFELLKLKNPLIHQITNYVAANDQANITLAAGARPIMAEHPAELEEILSSADSLLINTGTLTESKEVILTQAVELAGKYRVPVVLDPVGSAVSKLRKTYVLRLLESGYIDIIKGNMGEISVVFDIDDDVINHKGNSGVDYLGEISELSNEAKIKLQRAAERYNLVLVITGEKDFILNRDSIIECVNGSSLFNGITGAGCMTGSLIASYQSVSYNSFISAITGVVISGIAGQMVEKISSGPASFRVNIINQVARLTREDVLSHVNIHRH